MYSNQLRKQTKVTNKRILGKNKSQDSKDQVMDLLQGENVTILAKKMVISTTRKIFPITSMGTTSMKVSSKTFSVTQAKSELFVLKNTKQI